MKESKDICQCPVDVLDIVLEENKVETVPVEIFQPLLYIHVVHADVKTTFGLGETEKKRCLKWLILLDWNFLLQCFIILLSDMFVGLMTRNVPDILHYIEDKFLNSIVEILCSQ